MQTTAFNQKSWTERKQVLGKPAETAFEIFSGRKGIRFEHFGLKTESTLNYSKLKLFLRLRPDYLCQQGGRSFFVEIKGCGADGILKFKIESIEGLYAWQLITPVFIFLWDSALKRYCYLSYEDLRDRLYQCHVQRFDNDFKPYFSLPVDALDWDKL